jgi:predicted CopG family antitoxin
MGTHTQIMSKNIAISDDVYRKLKREKGDRSFSDVIEEKLETGARIADVTGTGVLDEAVYEAVTDDIERLSRGTETRLEEGFADENGR